MLDVDQMERLVTGHAQLLFPLLPDDAAAESVCTRLSELFRDYASEFRRRRDSEARKVSPGTSGIRAKEPG